MGQRASQSFIESLERRTLLAAEILLDPAASSLIEYQGMLVQYVEIEKVVIARI